jgi:hypothetical protein
MMMSPLEREIDRERWAKAKCACGAKAGHEIWQRGTHRYECCRCYVQAGGSPADWHQLCMQTYAEMKAKP